MVIEACGSIISLKTLPRKVSRFYIFHPSMKSRDAIEMKSKSMDHFERTNFIADGDQE